MKIVVVGGGTAGWIAALMLAKNHPDHKITIIASSDLGVLGAGEAVTGSFTDLLTSYYGDLSIDPIEFLRETAAMPKYGIMHKDWTAKKGQSYFGPIDGTRTCLELPDSSFCYLLANAPDYLHMSTFFGQMYQRDINPINKVTHDHEVSTFAFHFDAKLAAKYLEKITVKCANCTYIDAKITDVLLDENGFVKSVLLENKTEVFGDFFIDSSGFSRLIMKKLSTPWISYQKQLPVNAALPFFIDYKEGEKYKPYSTAWAQSAGWYWEAAVQTRKGCGYVFSEDFISYEQAQKEIESVLGHEIIPIKKFKFDTGRLENTWVKNCLAIGLCAAFAEPLEATSIHSTIHQLSRFSFNFLKPKVEDTLNPSSIKFYNNSINRMFDDFRDFLVSHYLGGRTDSEFWRYITEGNTLTDFSKHLKEMCKSRVPTVYDFNSYPGAAGWSIWSFILAGTGQISSETAKNHLTSASITNAENKLTQLRICMEKMSLTHYSFGEYKDVLYQKDIAFTPRRGADWHLGK